MSAASTPSLPVPPARRPLRRVRTAMLAFVLLFILPLATHAAWFRAQGWASNWSNADWGATGILPAPAASGATIHVMAARTGRWRGIFADHCWIVLKPEGVSAYRRYDVVGWGAPVRLNHRPPDGRWYGNPPRIIARIEGEAAARAIPRIEAAIRAYPFDAPGDYAPWPGPNSNSFIAHALAAAPELAVRLPPTAIGRDFREAAFWAGRTAQGGVGLQLGNWISLTAGWRDGLELGLFGAIVGLDLRQPALILPGWGRIGSAAGSAI